MAKGAEPADESATSDKRYYRIGEVSKITGVKPYVLRYWESEFRWMAPQKSKSKQRLYRKRDIDVIQLIKKLLYEQVGFSKKESAELVEKVFEAIKETLARGEKVKISGFGNFVVRGKNARKGRNPQTGQEILLEARRVLTFKPSLVLKNILNDEPVDEAAAAAENEE